MLAVVLSILLTLYLIVPEAIFRTVFGYFIPTRNFVLTRTETAYRAVLVAILPFSLALVASWYLPVVRDIPFPVKQNSVEERRADYRTVIAGLYAESEFRASQEQFWHAFTRCGRRQGRLALWYFLVVVIEAWLAGQLASKYAKFQGNRVYRWTADRLLFPFISEWYPLLTPYLHLLPGTRVQADILCTNDTLYQGIVSEYFVQDGKLSGIILDEPRRFERKLYLEAKKQAKTGGPKPDKNDFWISIPSENLYFFPDKIINMNLTYLSPAGTPVDLTAVTKLVRDLLSRSGIDLDKVTVSGSSEQTPPKP